MVCKVQGAYGLFKEFLGLSWIHCQLPGFGHVGLFSLACHFRNMEGEGAWGRLIFYCEHNVWSLLETSSRVHAGPLVYGGSSSVLSTCSVTLTLIWAPAPRLPNVLWIWRMNLKNASAWSCLVHGGTLLKLHKHIFLVLKFSFLVIFLFYSISLLFLHLQSRPFLYSDSAPPSLLFLRTSVCFLSGEHDPPVGGVLCALFVCAVTVVVCFTNPLSCKKLSQELSQVSCLLCQRCFHMAPFFLSSWYIKWRHDQFRSLRKGWSTPVGMRSLRTTALLIWGS